MTTTAKKLETPADELKGKELYEFIWFKLFKNGSKDFARQLVEDKGIQNAMLKHIKDVLHYDEVVAGKWKLDQDFEELGLVDVEGKTRQEWREETTDTSESDKKKKTKKDEGKHIASPSAIDYERLEIPLAEPKEPAEPKEKAESGKLLERKQGERLEIHPARQKTEKELKAEHEARKARRNKNKKSKKGKIMTAQENPNKPEKPEKPDKEDNPNKPDKEKPPHPDNEPTPHPKPPMVEPDEPDSDEPQTPWGPQPKQ